MRTPPLILIVDDNPTNLDILQTRLRANNYEVITAADGEVDLEQNDAVLDQAPGKPGER